MALLLLLRGRVRRAPRHRDPRVAADKLAVLLAQAILIGRGAAADRGFDRLVAEADTVAPGAGVLIARPAPDLMREAARAYRGSRYYSRLWLQDVVDGELRGRPNPERWAHGNRARVLRSIATTESSEAFTAEQTRSARAFADRNPDLAATLVRVWDAALDKRTCDVCERADGTWTGINEDFPDGEPGGVHGNCRCTWHTERLDWVA